MRSDGSSFCTSKKYKSSNLFVLFEEYSAREIEVILNQKVPICIVAEKIEREVRGDFYRMNFKSKMGQIKSDFKMLELIIGKVGKDKSS